ncbi:Kynurenine formamidase [Orchesella cincta]|uniref:Kynurenine formamidase n=1 Tax=Orchesella cincta TaxID=48709 RepID=A0A1D2MU12_ORCCI|nr:Kynurenine formamidase [Orchesella cincta]
MKQMASRSFCTSEHTSTHIDAPYHFNKNGRKLHEIPFEDLLNVPGVMIDIFDKVNKIRDGKLVVRQNYVVTRQDIMEWEAKNGKIPHGAVVLLYTGWGMRWGDNNAYLGIAENATVDINEFPPTYTNYPGYDLSAAKFLAEERQIRGAGIDTISIDPGNTKEFWAHRIFTSRNIYMLEMVANLHVLPPRGFSLYMLPFKIDGGTAAPTRVIAKLPCKGRKGLPVNDNESVHEEEL